MTFKRVVVTGAGALTPIGNNLQQYWEGLKAGKSGAAPITRFDASLFKTKFACEVKDFKIEDFIFFKIRFTNLRRVLEVVPFWLLSDLQSLYTH